MKREAPKQPAMTYSKRDSKGHIPDKNLINSLWMHTGNNKLYTVIGFVWDCDEDLWKIKYRPHYAETGDKIEYTRSIDNHSGMRGEEPRYVRVTREKDIDE